MSVVREDSLFEECRLLAGKTQQTFSPRPGDGILAPRKEGETEVESQLFGAGRGVKMLVVIKTASDQQRGAVADFCQDRLPSLSR